jgi:hypothetical protein
MINHQGTHIRYWIERKKKPIHTPSYVTKEKKVKKVLQKHPLHSSTALAAPAIDLISSSPLDKSRKQSVNVDRSLWYPVVSYRFIKYGEFLSEKIKRCPKAPCSMRQ